jgi:hypothetical protein
VSRLGKCGRYQFALEVVARSDNHLLRVCPQKNADTNERLSMLHEPICALFAQMELPPCVRPVQFLNTILRPLSLTVNPFVAAAAQKLLSERMEDLKSQDFACRSALQATLSLGCAQADLDPLLGPVL